MSKPVGNRLPEEILRAFDGHGLEDKIGPAHLLVTTDPDGTPRPCMVSAGEVLAPDDRHLRLALWPGTNTSRNLAAGSPVLFCFVAPGTALYVRGRSRPLGPTTRSKLERFEIEVASVESDVHRGMPVSGAITFSIEAMDAADVAASWERQIGALREP